MADAGHAQPTSRPPVARAPAPKRWWRAQSTKRDVFNVIVGVFGIVGTLVAIYTNFFAPDSGSSSPSAGAVSTSTPATTAATPTEDVFGEPRVAEPTDGADWAQVGTCLLEPGAPAPCDAVHYLEVYSLAPCTPDALVEYLGGVVGVDVLLSTIQTSEEIVDAVTLCEVRTPLDAGDVRPAADILTTRAGDSWRRCVDTRVAREVGCATDHTAEVIYAGDEDVVDCPGRAERYLEAPLSRFDGRLTVVQAGAVGSPTCFVEVLGDNVLTASIRSIRTSAPPIAATTDR